MTDIQNTEYITINGNGIFVGGRPSMMYRGEKIRYINLIKINFATAQRQNPNMQELQIGAFETKGKFAKQGNPSGNVGMNIWCRAKLDDGQLGPWVFYCDAFNSNAERLGRCIRFCINDVNHNTVMRSAVLDFTRKDSINTENKQNEQSKEQHKIISIIKICNFRITIEKIKQR